MCTSGGPEEAVRPYIERGELVTVLELSSVRFRVLPLLPGAVADVVGTARAHRLRAPLEARRPPLKAQLADVRLLAEECAAGKAGAVAAPSGTNNELAPRWSIPSRG